MILAYENFSVMTSLVEALYSQMQPGQMVIFRQPFRWKIYNGVDLIDSPIIPNMYETFSLEQVLAEKNLECVYDFKQAAIVRNR